MRKKAERGGKNARWTWCSFTNGNQPTRTNSKQQPINSYPPSNYIYQPFSSWLFSCKGWIRCKTDVFKSTSRCFCVSTSLTIPPTAQLKASPKAPDSPYKPLLLIARMLVGGTFEVLKVEPGNREAKQRGDHQGRVFRVIRFDRLVTF